MDQDRASATLPIGAQRHPPRGRLAEAAEARTGQVDHEAEYREGRPNPSSVGPGDGPGAGRFSQSVAYCHSINTAAAPRGGNMTAGQTPTTEDISNSIRALVDRLVDARFSQELAKRGTEVGNLATDAWRDAEPIRRDAARALGRAGDDAAAWSRKSLRPWLREAWKRRAVALGAASAAVPVGRELVEDAAIRLGIRQRREERHWAAFFWGLVLGALAGAAAAMLTTPKRGSELRDEISTRADDLAARARDEWVPMFERATGGSEHATEALDDLDDAAAHAATSRASAVEGGADQAAEAAGDVIDATDREPA
ncbi:MAG: YtxH domain-containing protein [Alphaproteobacteria bacterium]|nr:YtxH domain-containing protein [Alphaproteobacteria bacterium]